MTARVKGRLDRSSPMRWPPSRRASPPNCRLHRHFPPTNPCSKVVADSLPSVTTAVRSQRAALIWAIAGRQQWAANCPNRGIVSQYM